ncbi:GTP-binding protein 10 homolog [Lasioglossum baleicum]|uniref:GTP-binding protein 10 homolog n=1 Tax=Lasioglossum baleicum TaxID=434251 RepID=UPI003FCDD9BF
MVVLTHILGYANKLARKFRQRGLIDSLRIHVKGGIGGSGLPRYGGVGGAGGNVFLVSEEGLTLEMVKSKIKNLKLKAGPGGESTSRGIIGTPGTDLNIHVPVGITVYDDNNVQLGEVNLNDTKLLIAKGGLGGCENTGYCGVKGENRTIILDLRLIADVGLVGFPNAGKSTFLNAVSKAKPKIASYPFTTIRPQIGIVNYKDDRRISIADLPGLIEGAHINKGMGHQFLKHVERTKLLLFIVDIKGFQLSHKYKYRSCLETILLLNKEIELYKPDLLKRPAMLLINKMDTKDANKIFDEIKSKLNNLSEIASEFDESIRSENFLQFDDILPTSLISKNKNETQEIKEKLRNIIDKYEEAKYDEGNTDSMEHLLQAKLRREMQRYASILT